MTTIGRSGTTSGLASSLSFTPVQVLHDDDDDDDDDGYNKIKIMFIIIDCNNHNNHNNNSNKLIANSKDQLQGHQRIHSKSTYCLTIVITITMML